jgi:hypothetical protein
MWPDASLGCPRPGQSYTKALVPGYRVCLSAAPQVHEYHTDLSGRAVYYPSLLVATCQSDLASRLGTTAAAIHLVSIEEVTWPNAALGCPEPGMDYAQEPVPGFCIIVQAGGPIHEYHTDMGVQCVYVPLDWAM